MKKTLITSFLTLIFSVFMLVGTTFAWWHDTESATSKFYAGKLDVSLDISNNGNIWFKSNQLFNPELVEPGFTETKYLKIQNVGNIDLAYRLVFDFINPLYADYFEFTIEIISNNGKAVNRKLPEFKAFEIDADLYAALTPGEYHIIRITYRILPELDKGQNMEIFAFDTRIEAFQTDEIKAMGNKAYYNTLDEYLKMSNEQLANLYNNYKR